LTLHAALLGWLAGVTTLQRAVLALFLSTTEYYCAPVWCLSTHIHLVDPAVNNALWIVSGCLHPTPGGNKRPIIAGFQPAELHHKAVILSLACHAIEPERLLHSALTSPLSGNAQHLKSTHICSRHTTTHQFI